MLSLTALTLGLSFFSYTAQGAYPFSQIIGFGDQLTDDGRGSYAHGVTNPGGNNPKVYGAGTWTNGPVAISWLSNLINVPVSYNYAFGGANGGASPAATIDNAFTSASWGSTWNGLSGSPDAKQQIANYSAHTGGEAAQSLHFLWIGNNDAVVDWMCTPTPFQGVHHIDLNDATGSNAWATQLGNEMKSRINELKATGAQYIFVPNLFPSHLAPRTKRWYTNDTTQIAHMGNAVQNGNKAIASAVASFNDPKIKLYDAYSQLMSVYNNPAPWGIVHTSDFPNNYCDGSIDFGNNFDSCLLQGHGQQWFWLTEISMTTWVDLILALDMSNVIKATWNK